MIETTRTDSVGRVAVELTANTSAFNKSIKDTISTTKNSFSNAMNSVKSVVSSAFNGKEVISYQKQIDYLQYKLDDLKATLSIANDNKGLFGTTEIKEMEAEAEQLQNQLIRMKEVSGTSSSSIIDDFKGIKEAVSSAFSGDKANELTSKFQQAGQAGMNALQQLSSGGDGLGSKMAGKVLPAVEKLAPAFSKAIPYVGQVVAVAQGLVAVGKNIKNVFEKVITTVKNMATKVKDAISKVVSGFKNAINKAKEFVGLSSKADSSWSSALKKIASMAAAAFSVRAMYNFAKEGVQLASETQSAWTGLYSVVSGTGKSFSEAQGFIEEYISDGLIPLNDAVSSYKNLISAGYDEEQAKSIMTNLKDSSAFGRQSYLSMGEAVKTATDGIKNENSVLVDNAGVTKNLSVIYEEYAASIGKTASQLTAEEKRLATVNGLMNETKFQTGDAAKYADTFAGKLAKLSTAFTNLKRTVGQVVAPIIELFLPAITKAVNALTAMFNKLKSIMSVFGLEMKEYVGGQTSSAISSAADSANGLTDGLENAGDTATATAKKIKKAFSGVDEINVLNTKNESDNGTGLGSGIDTGSIGGALDDSINNPLEEQKENIKQNLDWLSRTAYDWGVAFAESINKGLSMIPWDKIQATVNGAVQKIAEFLNGAVAGLDWHLLGTTFGNGFNTIIYGLTTWYDTFDWSALGTGLGEGVNGIIDSVDFEETGRLFALKFNSIFEVASNFLGTVRWGDLGKNLVNGLNTTIKTLNFDEVGKTLENGLNGAIDFMWNAVKTFDAKTAGKQIASLLNNISEAIKNTDWKKLGETFSEGLHKSIELVRTFIKKTDWGALVKNVIDGITNFLVGVDWGQLALDVIGLLWDVGVALVEGLWQGIKSAIVGVGKVLYDILVQPIVDGVKKLFGIHSPSTVFAEIGGYLIEGLWQGISGAKDWIVKKWDEVKGWFTDIVKTASIKITQKWDDIKKKWTDLTSNIKNKTADMKAKVATKWDDIKKGWSNITSKIKNKTAEMKAKIPTTWKDLKEKWQNITKHIIDKEAKMKAKIGTTWNSLKNTWNNLMSHFKDKTITISAKVGEVVGSFKGTINDKLIKPINNKLPNWMAKIPYLAQGGWVKANNPQLAVVGDNKREPEIVSPESKIKEQVIKGIEEMGGATQNQHFDFTIKLEYPDGKYLIKEINDTFIKDGKVSLLI